MVNYQAYNCTQSDIDISPPPSLYIKKLLYLHVCTIEMESTMTMHIYYTIVFDILPARIGVRNVSG